MKRFCPIRDIIVYDNVFDLQELWVINSAVNNSLFTLNGWHDRYDSGEQYMHSNWSIQDLNNHEILEFRGIKNIFEESEGKYSIEKITDIKVNIDTLADSHWPHTHDTNVMLIYVSEEWRPSWGGETLFYDREAKEIIYGSQYTPNRVILFDGAIPHNIKQQNRTARKHRFTLSIFFKKD